MEHLHDILTILEKDSRLTSAQIADMTDLTIQEVESVIKSAEAEGIIRRYKTVINWSKAGKDRVLAYIDCKVMPIRGRGFDDVAERIYRFPEVISVHLVSGVEDLRVIVEGATMQDVASFVSEKLATIDRVQSTATNFVLKRYKEDHDIVAEGDEDHRLAVTP